MGNVVGQNTTYTGNPASFTGVAESVVSSVLVPIVPVQSGSGDPSPSNPRPISGLTSATVYHTGKNIWYEDIADWKVGYYINASGEETENSSYKYCQAYFPVFESTGYAVRYRKGTSSGYALTVCYYDSDKTFISIDTAISASSTTGVKTGTFTTPADCQYIRISCPRVNSTDIQIEVGSTSTDYEDSGSTYAADWTSSAGTVYGGTVDLVTGVLTVDKAIVDLGGLSWTMYAATGTSSGYAFYAEKSDSINRDTSRICSSYWVSDVVGLADTIAEYGITDKFSFASTNKRIFIVDSSYADADALKTGLNGVQMVYTLRTPQIYQLPTGYVSALVGPNYLWGESNQSISVTVVQPVAGFQGWLIKAVTNGTPVEIPLKYIRAETYTVTPDQRMEWSAERDVTGVLHRETVQNLPPKIEFNTPLLTNTDVNALNSIIKAAFTSYLQRNITIQFYDPERDQYWEWDCYMPDVHYSIRMVDSTNKVVHYEETRYAFIGR